MILPTATALNPRSLPDLVARHGVTFTDFVPSVLATIVSHLEERPSAWPHFRTLRRILVGGEAMVSGPVYRFMAMCPHVGLTNTYGPTETSIGVIFGDVPKDFTPIVPIGRPIDNVRAVILDRAFNPVPPGVTGELCIGGVCVGAGYLGDEQATAEAFLSNPFPELRCSLLYRTGDLATFARDGTIAYLGRADDQLKINGVRIEPGEIESVLLAHPRVRQAAVAVPEDTPRRLTAFISAVEPTLPLDAAGIRAFAAARLPAALVPEQFVLLEELPATSSGKLDRKSVLRQRGRRLNAVVPHVAPRDDIERYLCGLWGAVLQTDAPGIDDDFFETGGDSLLAMALAARVQEERGLDVPVRALYAHPTVRALATLPIFRNLPTRDAWHRTASAAETDLLARQRSLLRQWKGWRDREDSYLFTLNAGGGKSRLFWCCQGAREFEQLAAYLGPEQPVTGMRSGHEIMTHTPENVATLAAHYADEMARLQPSGPLLLGGNCQGGLIARATANHLQRRGREVALLVLMEQTQFTPYDGRVALLFGRQSRLNPFTNGTSRPEDVFSRAYPAGYRIGFMDGAHGEFFSESNIESLAAAVSDQLAAASGGRDTSSR